MKIRKIRSMKIKTFVNSADNIDRLVNRWQNQQSNIRITNRYVDSEWITIEKVCSTVTKKCMVTMIIEYEELSE